MKQSKMKKKAIEAEGTKRKGDVEKTAMQLESKIESMVEKLQKDLTKVEESIGGKLHLLDADNDGVSTDCVSYMREYRVYVCTLGFHCVCRFV